MMERPENPVEYIENKMCQIRDIGPENINWETLISHLHPYRDNIRRQLIRDGSIFDKEYSEILGEVQLVMSQSVFIFMLCLKKIAVVKKLF